MLMVLRSCYVPRISLSHTHSEAAMPSKSPRPKAGAGRRAEPYNGLGSGPFRLLPGEDKAEFDGHLQDLVARYTPADEAELRCLEEMVQVAFRQRRVDELEVRVLQGIFDGRLAAFDGNLPSLDMVI